jgi:outer membrane PBP1 activator LpoA protein
MKKGLVVFPVLVAAMILSGCAGTSAQSALSKADKDKAYLKVFRDEYPNAASTDSQLLQLAAASCDAFDKGASQADIINVIREKGRSAGVEIGYAVGVAVPIYCPEYQSKIKGG